MTEEHQGTPESYERVRQHEVADEVERAEVLRGEVAQAAGELAAGVAQTASDLAAESAETAEVLRGEVAETAEVLRGEAAETAEALRAKSAETAEALAAKTASDIASVTEALRDLRATISETIDTAIVDRLDVLERRLHERTFNEVRHSRVKMILVIASAVVGAIILGGVHAHECVGGAEMFGVRQALCDITQPTHAHGVGPTVWQLVGVVVYVGGLAGLWAWLSFHLDRRS